MTGSGDRTVHARYPGMEIVRYDRAGKWYLEPVNALEGARLPRQPVSVTDAARQAVWFLAKGGEVFFGKPGGSTFDRKVRGNAQSY